MSWPIRHLPVIQQWDCQGCTSCCRDYRVFITDTERDCILKMDWSGTDLAGEQLVAVDPSGTRLAQRADGRCVFLSDQGRCRIHEKHGSAAKPFACRLYPFVLIPTHDHWRVGLRYSCPASARNEGRPLVDHKSELQEMAAELAAREGLVGRPVPPPALQPGQNLSWPDLLRITEALQSIMDNSAEPLARRWRKCLALSALCRNARFEKVQGKRLSELLDLLVPSLDTEVPVDPAPVALSWIARVLFRQVLSVYLRKDAGPDRGPAARSRLALLRSAWRFARGRGSVPRLVQSLPDTTFAQIESAKTVLPESATRIFERYYQVKIGALQFCGSAHFGMSFWEGLDALALTLPVLFWLMRAWSDQPAEVAATQAIRIVDHNFGYSPHLGTRMQRFALGVLARRGDIERLIVHYGPPSEQGSRK